MSNQTALKLRGAGAATCAAVQLCGGLAHRSDCARMCGGHVELRAGFS